jgi:predicted DNA-binding transcriptional regulator AlpA
MEKETRPLYTLSVEEFIELSRTIAVDNSFLLTPSDLKEKMQNDIIYLEDVMELTGYKNSTVYSKVCRNQIPFISGGRPLTFSREEITQWIKDGRPTIAEIKAKKWGLKS